jgi:ABC-type phosphate transport system substrate-binding protein
MTLRLNIFILLTILLFSVNAAIAGDIVIIGNKYLAESSLKKQDLRDIYLGKKTGWSDNKKIVFAIQENPTVTVQFLKNYIHKSATQYASYWKEKVFTGKGIPPKSFSSDKDLIEFVARTEGAVGYVSSVNGLDTVKILRID